MDGSPDGERDDVVVFRWYVVPVVEPARAPVRALLRFVPSVETVSPPKMLAVFFPGTASEAHGSCELPSSAVTGAERSGRG